MFGKNTRHINVPTQYFISLDPEYSQMKDVSEKVAGFIYTVVLHEVIGILDVVLKSKQVFANVSYELNEEYEKLTYLLRLIKSRRDVEIPLSEIRAFSSLHADYVEMSTQWKVMREVFLDDIRILSQRYGSPVPPYKYQLPLDIEKCFGKIDELLRGYLDDQDELDRRVHPHDWDKTTGSLSYKGKSLVFSLDTKIHSVYSFLEDNFTRVASLKGLNKITGSKNQTTNIISAIRKRLKGSGLSEYLEIKSTGEGGYTLKLR